MAAREMCCSMCERVGAVWAEPGVLCCAAPPPPPPPRRPTGGVLGVLKRVVLKRGVLKRGDAEGGVLKEGAEGGC